MFCLFALALAAAPPPAVPAVVVVTDASWKGVDTLVAGWESPTFDDRKWAAAGVTPGSESNGAHYSVNNQFGLDSAAKWVWGGRDDTTYLRRSFDVPAVVRRAEVLWMADDDADLYVNGDRVEGFSSTAGAYGNKGVAAVVDLAPYLVPGKANVVAVKVVNSGGPRGLAMEIRVNGAPFFEPLRKIEPVKLPEKVAATLPALAADLDADSFDERQKAAKRLVALANEYGLALKPFLDKLAASESAEVRAKARPAIAVLRREAEKLSADLDPPMGQDGRFFYGNLPFDAIREFWVRTDRHLVPMRHLHHAKRLQSVNEANLVDAMAAELRAAKGEQETRVVAYVALLELRALAPALGKIVRDRPKTRAAAVALSALRRWGLADKATLDAAKACGSAPTERMAK